MAGEDEESEDPNSINRKPVWQRIIITAAGSLSNILLGIIVMAVMVLSSSQLYSTTVAGFPEKGAVSCDYGLKEGDRITITKCKFSNEKYTAQDGTTKSAFRFIILEASVDAPRDAEQKNETTAAPSAPETKAANDDCPW